jgi:molybdopterin-guanine dinucleotide biosynthesis protein A
MTGQASDRLETQFMSANVMPIPPLYGLILAGGASRRMQTDKAALAYHGKSQLAWSYDLLAKFTDRCFVSLRPDQRSDAVRANFPQILDTQPGIGPIAGILAALQTHPQHAWLVLACDLPFLTEHTLQHLIAQREPAKSATAYRSTHDGLPEPLCAIWEPASREPLQVWLHSDQRCPRKFLITTGAALLDAQEPAALDNINTPEEYRASQTSLSHRHS